MAVPIRALAPSLLLAAACVAPSEPVPERLRRVAADLEPFVGRALRDYGVPGIWVAVLDAPPGTAEATVWTRGLQLDGGGGVVGAPADAVHRVASISKLYTATAAMVLAEQGALDLRAPVSGYVPAFAPANPFGRDVTTAMLLAHRGGLVRESPVGHYFDPGEPTLAATVASLADTSLVFAPGTRFKYSNPGAGVVGEVVARLHGTSFEQAVRELVLDPLGLGDSSFEPRPDLVARQAAGTMWTYDGRGIPTPTFAFGYAPAANLRATTTDLVRFAATWFPWSTRRVLSPEAQAAMWKLPDGVERGCGMGFFVEPFEGHRMVGHDGAVYGFASSLRALPDQGLAVAVVCTLDFANAVAEAIARRALSALLANRAGRTLAPAEFPRPVGAALARSLAGSYRCGEYHVQLQARGEELFYDPDLGVRTRLGVAADGALVADDRLGIDTGRRLVLLPNGNPHDGDHEYVREEAPPPSPPADLLPLLGEYGWDHDVLIVYEDRGRLAVLIEWVVRDLPDREGPDRYRFGPGLYGGDPLVFERSADGDVVAAVVGGARFVRRSQPDPRGFRVAPLRPIAELQAEAARAIPPAVDGDRPFDLIELAGLDPTLRFDLRYATADNFLGTRVYSRAVAKLQRPAAEALVRVHRALAQKGFGLLVFDAYRPWSVTKVFFDATPPELRHFVADPAQGSRHNRGSAVDVSLFALATGSPVEMPSGFDEFTPRAYPDYPGGTSIQRHHREVLRAAMEAEGFTVYEHEWWHFDYAEWRRYPVGNEPL